jgi:formamidopyrimidine-DNA glycosylase
MEDHYDNIDEQLVQADQRRIYKGRSRHTCPDCGTPNALTDEQKRRGYHCDACTRALEWGCE